MIRPTVTTSAKVPPVAASDAAGRQRSTSMASRMGWFVRDWLARASALRAPMPDSLVFRILLAGSSVSMLGSRISTIAFPMLVLHLNKSPFIAGLVTCAALLPSMLAYLPAGALVDRWDPWIVMLASEVMRGLAVCAVVIHLGVSGWHVSIYFLMLYIVAEEILEIFWMLADRRCLSRLMEFGKVAERQASIEVRSHAAILFGRPIGPWLFTLTPFAPFLADAFSFVVSACTLMVIRGPVARKGQPQAVPPRRLRREIADGFWWLKTHLHASAVMILLSYTTLIAQALIMMFLAEAHDHRLSTLAIGVALAASGLGGAVGSAIANRLPKQAKRFWLQILLCAWSAALGLLALGGVQLPWCIAAVMLILGLTGSVGNIQFATYLVKKVDNDMLGRVTSIGQVMTIAAFGVGPFLGGAFIQTFGIQVAIGIFFGFVLMVALASFCMPRIFRLTTERSPEATDTRTKGFAQPNMPGLDVTSVPL